MRRDHYPADAGKITAFYDSLFGPVRRHVPTPAPQGPTTTHNDRALVILMAGGHLVTTDEGEE